MHTVFGTCAACACACACACVSRWRELCEVVGSLTFVSTTSSARASATPRPPSSRRCSPCLNSCPAPPISFLTSSHRCVACSIVICIVQRQLGPPLHKRIRVSPLQSPSDRREHSAMSIAPRTTSGELVSPCISTNAWKAVGRFSRVQVASASSARKLSLSFYRSLFSQARTPPISILAAGLSVRASSKVRNKGFLGQCRSGYV